MTETEPNNQRERRQIDVALSVLRETIDAVASRFPADSTLARIFKQHHEFGSRDRRHYAHVVFSYFRWRGWVVRLAPDDLARQVAWALALEGVDREDGMLTLWLSQINADASLHTLDLSAKAARLRDCFPEAAFALNDLMPDWVREVITDDPTATSFISSCQSRPPTWVCVEAHRVHDFSVMLTAQQVKHRVEKRIRGAVALEPPFQLQLLERAWGWSIQVQDIGSQVVAAVCDAQPGSSWWDACCGAGGKTLQLSRQVGPDGAVLATDTRESILANLHQRAEAFRCTNIKAIQLDSTNEIPSGRVFDGVLVDAPCSGLGTWPRNPDARWRITPEDLAARADTQRQLLANVAPRIKQGGVLVYSLCTITTAESRDVTAWFLEQFPHFQLDPFTDPLTANTFPGERFILPAEGPGDGMYVARLRRIA